jgi:hypothetical protein
MGMKDSLSEEFGIVNFLGEKGLVTSGRRGEINRVLVEFLTENSLPIEKYNPRYKGFYDAMHCNAVTCQENWNKFHVWVNKKVKENENV